MKKFKIPDTIYLICYDDDGELMEEDDEILWCEDNIDNHGIKYIREEEKDGSGSK